MDSYLSKINKETPKSSNKKVVVEKIEEYSEEDNEYISQKRSIFQKFLDFISGESIEPIDDDSLLDENLEESIESKPERETQEEQEFEEMEDKPKQSIFAKIRSFLYFQKDNEEIILEGEEFETLVDDEIKEALKIQNKWLKELPASKIREFKCSKDYEKYKEILEKYNLIKNN